MVTYLKLHLHPVQQLFELVDIVAIPLAESLHDLSRILVSVGGADPPRSAPPDNRGITSRGRSEERRVGKEC